MRLTVIAHPNSKKPHIDKDLFGQLHVYVSAPPLDGRANSAVVEALAEFFKCSKSQVKLKKGERGKIKVFEIGI